MVLTMMERWFWLITGGIFWCNLCGFVGYYGPRNLFATFTDYLLCVICSCLRVVNFMWEFTLQAFVVESLLLLWCLRGQVNMCAVLCTAAHWRVDSQPLLLWWWTNRRQQSDIWWPCWTHHTSHRSSGIIQPDTRLSLIVQSPLINTMIRHDTRVCVDWKAECVLKCSHLFCICFQDNILHKPFVRLCRKLLCCVLFAEFGLLWLMLI